MAMGEMVLRTAIDAGLIIASRGKLGVGEFAGRVARDGLKLALKDGELPSLHGSHVANA